MAADEVREAIELFEQSQNARDRLSEWERNFMKDQLERWHEYGEDIRVSAKQFAVIERIYLKMTGLK